MEETTPTAPQCDNDSQGGSSAEFRQDIVDLGSSTIRTSRGSIHTLTIVGQIEGHQELPSNAKAPNMSTSSPCWRQWRKARMWTACWCSSIPWAATLRRALLSRS